MTTYTVVPVDSRSESRSLTHWGSAEVRGLKYGAEHLKYWPEDTGEDVRIIPGMEHSLGDEDSLAKALLSTLYDLLQMDAGGNIGEHDDFVVEGLGWKYEVKGKIHVVPVVESFPPGMWERIDAAEKKRQSEENKYKGWY